ncbi:hypothetical protein WM09_05375 [Burkholderia ubonensis]|uniref:hypothetical protein n=1 Tax=Burkholderia ubonensis TaxID=101571 RepID=UPI000759D640|nr:hypothetical protein [Burkholderia ubonensis]KWI94370.1 hypothetical protein WM09_05375 [Burkholderia ubonensis]
MPDDVTLIVGGQSVAGRLKRPPTLAVFKWQPSDRQQLGERVSLRSLMQKADVSPLDAAAVSNLARC